VTCCCSFNVERCEDLDRAFLARPKQDHALQAPQAEWTNVIVEREMVLIFGHRHRLAACREDIPYGILLRRIFLFSNWKRREYTAKPALKPNSCHAALSPPMSEKGSLSAVEPASEPGPFVPRQRTCGDCTAKSVSCQQRKSPPHSIPSSAQSGSFGLPGDPQSISVTIWVFPKSRRPLKGGVSRRR
jgi:hypothetical protein